MIVFKRFFEGTLLLQLLLEHGCWAAVMRANMAMSFFGKGINTSLSLSLRVGEGINTYSSSKLHNTYRAVNMALKLVNCTKQVYFACCTFLPLCSRNINAIGPVCLSFISSLCISLSSLFLSPSLSPYISPSLKHAQITRFWATLYLHWQ
jgi:hypothetical protein